MEKIKLFLWSERGKSVLVVIIIILVGTGSFQLGRLSKNPSSGVKVVYPDLSTISQVSKEANIIATEEDSQDPESTLTKSLTTAPRPTSQQSTTAITKNFFASNRGSKYYPVLCSAGKTIKIENRVYFETRAQAETAGYELSSSCK